MRISLLIAVGSLAIIQCYAIPLSTPKEGRSSELTPVQVEELGKIREETQGVFKKDEEIQKQSGGESESSPSSTEASQQAENSSQKQVEEKKDANEKSVLDDKKDENVEGAKREEKKLKEGARQSSGSDDDDDDDDDDDLDLGVDDDDDDDDDDESGTAADSDDDDDDDDDYFERFFDDILGEDDDDDDVSPSTGGQQPAQSSQQQPVASVNVETSIQEGSDSQEVVDNSGEGLQSETEATLDGTAEDTDADTLIDKDPSESAVQNTVQQPVVVEPVPADNNASSDDDDDDDDDEGDITDLTSDDDDDDDDDDDAADDDDEDDDDETDLDDVLEAKRSRALQPPKMSSIYVTKYNKFVDNIISRINRILGKSYDPVRVKLQSNDSKKKNKTKNKTTKRKSNKRKSMNRPRMPEMSNKMGDFEIARSNPNNEANETSYVLISKTASNAKSDTKNNTIEIRSNTSNKRRKSGSNSKNKKNKKGSSSKQAPRARATLFGLSSIKRDGDVVVNMLSNYTTVKTDFILGPLTLRVEKEFGRGAKKEVKSATATTAEMHGKLNLKIIHGGAATLSSIKVLQPRQVRVDSAENHEKTKEYVWKRSSHIATLVSQKLASAARSMLKPPPNKSLIEHLLSKQNK